MSVHSFFARFSTLARPVAMVAAAVFFAAVGAAVSTVLSGGETGGAGENPSSREAGTRVASESPNSAAPEFALSGDGITPIHDSTDDEADHHAESHSHGSADHPGDSLNLPSAIETGTAGFSAGRGVDSVDGLLAPVPSKDILDAVGGKGSVEGASDRQRVTDTNYIAGQVAVADEHLRGGNYPPAISVYQQLRKSAAGSLDAALQFRLALCAEAYGNYAEAVDAYQRISANSAFQAWHGAAAIGEVRCLVAQRRYDVLHADLLSRLLLDESAFPQRVRTELLHLLGRSYWYDQSPDVAEKLLQDTHLVVPEWRPDPHQTLDEVAELIQLTPPPQLEPQLSLTQLSGRHPEAIFLRVHSTTAPVSQLLSLLLRRCGLEYESTPDAALRMDGRTLGIHVQDRGLSLLLDGLTMSLGNVWRIDGTRIQILAQTDVGPEELLAFRLGVADRMLRTALYESPDSKQAGHSRLALSAVLFRRSRPADAAQILQVQMQLAPQSPISTEVGFDLGKCHLVLRRFEESRLAFLRAIDASGGPSDLKVAAYLYVGRIQIMTGAAQSAPLNLMRGLSLSERSSLEPHAAMLLASNYLLIGSPQGANSVLMERRAALAKPELRNASAFLASLARFRAAVLADRREREGHSVVAALASFRPEEQFGAHWTLLAGEAAEELGLTQPAAEFYSTALAQEPAAPLRNQILLKLAARFRADERLEDAGKLLRSMSPEESADITRLASLRAAEVAFEKGEPANCILQCRNVLQDPSNPDLRRAALKLMGRSYERLRNHHAAVYCYAGVVPDNSLVPNCDPAPEGAQLPSRADFGTTPQHSLPATENVDFPQRFPLPTHSIPDDHQSRTSGRPSGVQPTHAVEALSPVPSGNTALKTAPENVGSSVSPSSESTGTPAQSTDSEGSADLMVPVQPAATAGKKSGGTVPLPYANGVDNRKRDPAVLYFSSAEGGRSLPKVPDEESAGNKEEVK